jgi:hypothetical protein
MKLYTNILNWFEKLILYHKIVLCELYSQSEYNFANSFGFCKLPNCVYGMDRKVKLFYPHKN